MTALDRIELALDRLAAAAARAKEARLASTSHTLGLEERNATLREAVGNALGQIDTLIARVEKDA